MSPISVTYLHYVVDGQLALKTNHPYLYQVMSPIKLEICVYTTTCYISWRAVKTGYKVIFCRFCLASKVSTCGNTIYIYISNHLNKANNAGCKHIKELHTLLFNLFYYYY